MSSDHELNEFGLLLDQFHAVVREGSDSIEDIFDAEIRRRFSELINRFAEPDIPDPADLRARVAACAFGFLTLIQFLDGPER